MSTGNIIQDAIAALNRGAWDKADTLCRELAVNHAHFPDAVYMRGFIALNQGRYKEAAEFISLIIALRPEFGEAWGHMAAALAAMNAGRSALSAFHHQALSQPHNVQAWFGFGIQALQLGLGPLAAAILEHALQMAPGQIDILSRLGSAHALAGNYDRAFEVLSTAIAVQPDLVEAQINLGHVKIVTHDFSGAIAPTKIGLALDPSHLLAWVNLSVIFERLCCYDEAMAPVGHALRLKPQDRNALVALAAVEKAKGSFTVAADCLRQACIADPDYRAGVVNLGLIQLLQGDFDKGFAHFEARFGLAGFELPDLEIPLWQGEELTGRSILIRHEQGLGDSLQFSRYADELCQMAADVVIVVQPALVRLFRHSFPNLTIIQDGDPIPRTDFFCPLMSLPHRLKLQHHGITPRAPLKSMPELIAAWQLALGPKTKPRIGIAWSGNPAFADDHTRSLRLADIAPLLNLPMIEFHVVQRDISTHDRHGVESFTGLRRHRLSDMSDTAALMSCMDLIISSDTSTAHLAGGLGLKAWVMLCAVPDWRWFLNCDTSPWYLSVRLFRQSQLGQWTQVIDLVRSALEGDFLCQQP